ncbi:MAG: extracellular solute-binding protein, partial [Anaerolineae bacterium]|nr:extracellular solute-binding protein [Anaerolineae bacterium]
MSIKQHKSSSLSRRDFLKSAAALGAGLTFAQSSLPQAAYAQSAVAEVEFWDMVWGPPEYIETAQKLVDQFNESQSAIKVTYQSTPWSNWYQTFLTAIGSGTAPDVSTGAGYQAVQFFDFGAIMPLDDLVADMKADGSADDFLPGLVDRLTYQDQHVALPWAIDIRVPYYRKDLYEAAGISSPTTWDEFAAATKATTSGEQYGMVIPSAATVLGSHNLFMFMFNNGGGFFAEDGSLDVMNERNVETMQFFANMVKDGSIHPGSAGFGDSDADKAFLQSTAATFVRGPGLETREDMAEIKDQVGLMSPLASSHNTYGTIFWINNMMVYTQTENPDATLTFLKWYSENQKPLWTEGHTGQMPTRSSFASDPYFQDNPYT